MLGAGRLKDGQLFVKVCGLSQGFVHYRTVLVEEPQSAVVVDGLGIAFYLGRLYVGHQHISEVENILGACNDEDGDVKITQVTSRKETSWRSAAGIAQGDVTAGFREVKRSSRGFIPVQDMISLERHKPGGVDDGH